MKPISEQKALERLAKMRSELRSHIAKTYEQKAKSCIDCKTPGACCLDAHFVNVRISRLEAVAIRQRLESLDSRHRSEVDSRIDSAVKKYSLSADGDANEQKFACPLFEKGAGCLVHEYGKPAPCILHACYENEMDLPPSGLQSEYELRVDKLNTRAYGRPQPSLPIPLAIKAVR